MEIQRESAGSEFQGDPLCMGTYRLTRPLSKSDLASSSGISVLDLDCAATNKLREEALDNENELT